MVGNKQLGRPIHQALSQAISGPVGTPGSLALPKLGWPGVAKDTRDSRPWLQRPPSGRPVCALWAGYEGGTLDTQPPLPPPVAWQPRLELKFNSPLKAKLRWFHLAQRKVKLPTSSTLILQGP